jgi:hypothetical protein
MLTLLIAATIAAAPAIQPPAQKAEAPKAEAPCDMPCCKGKKMPCCDKMADKKAEAPAEGGHGAHEHDH